MTPTLLSDAELKEIEAHTLMCGQGTLQEYVGKLLSHIAALQSAPSESEIETLCSRLAGAIVGRLDNAIKDAIYMLRHQAATIVRVEKERDEARRLALEEAAWIAEAEQAVHADGDGEIWIAMKIAQGIRALKSETPND